MEDLKHANVLVVSGLAFGIDTIAHKAAIKNNLQTVGVLAHGLDRIYPPPNKTLAKLGFEFVETFEGIPSWINFQQKVNKWVLTREHFELLFDSCKPYQ